MNVSWFEVDIFVSHWGILILIVIYVPILVGVYFTAEGRGESGFLWVVLCMFLPGVGIIILIAWVTVSKIRNREPATRHAKGMGTPDVELSRDRLVGRPEFTGRTYENIDKHITQREWDKAEELVKSILEEAEQTQNGPTIADMIGYLDRIKKGRRG